jgi:hypothetical protein
LNISQFRIGNLSILVLPVHPEHSNARVASRELAFAPSLPLSGIIAYLTSQFGGNVHDRNIVNITANRV